MKKNISSVRLPDIIVSCYTQNFIKCVILFGSSVYSSKPKDIDLAIVTTKGHFYDFIKAIKNNDEFKKYDISLIKEEEINKNFYFGGHGIHLIESFRKGIALIGDNIFMDSPVSSKFKIKQSIFERMKEYIYVLRKSYFDKGADKKFYARYEKIIKLSVFLLTNDFTFPEVLKIKQDQAIKSLKKVGIIITNNKKENVENLWLKINKQYL